MPVKKIKNKPSVKRSEFIFDFVNQEIDTQRWYRGTIKTLKIVTDEVGVKKLRIWICLDDFAEEDTFLMSIKIENRTNSRFYRFCQSMDLMKRDNRSKDIKEVLVGMRIEAMLINTDEASVLVNKLKPLVESEEANEEEIEDNNESFEDIENEDFDIEEEDFEDTEEDFE